MPDVYVNGFIQPFVNGTTAAGIKVNNTYVLQADSSGVTVRPDIAGKITMGSYPSAPSYGALWFGTTLTAAAVSIFGNGSDLETNAPGASGRINFRIANANQMAVRTFGFHFISTQSPPADGTLNNGEACLTWNGTNVVLKKKIAGVVTTVNLV